MRFVQAHLRESNLRRKEERAMKKAMMMVVVAGAAAVAGADVRITEWMYQGADGEFIEITNLGNASVDLTGWSFDDDSRTPGSFMLSGNLGAGESLVITESTAAAFRAAWGLAASVQVLGDLTNNLGRNDEINIYDGGGNLVDRLTYGDQNFPGSFRTQNISANPGVIGANDVISWSGSFVGDVWGSYASSGGDIANPGVFVPAPGAAVLLALGGLVAGRRRG